MVGGTVNWCAASVQASASGDGTTVRSILGTEELLGRLCGVQTGCDTSALQFPSKSSDAVV